MLGLEPRMWAKLALGLLVIGGTFAVLWAAYRPGVRDVVQTKPAPKPPLLRDTGALVVLRLPGPARERRSQVTCDGHRRAATGFWSASPAEACDALASTRVALLSGGGCAVMSHDRIRLHAVGHFGLVRFDHQAQQGGCPDPDVWLRVDALASPVVAPDRKLVGPTPG